MLPESLGVPDPPPSRGFRDPHMMLQHEYHVARLTEPPVLIWTDARWEPKLLAPAGVGFVVAFPRPGTAVSADPSLEALRGGYDIVNIW